MAPAQERVDVAVARGGVAEHPHAVLTVFVGDDVDPASARAAFCQAHQQVPVLVAAAQLPSEPVAESRAAQQHRRGDVVLVGELPGIERGRRTLAPAAIAEQSVVAPAERQRGVVVQCGGQLGERSRHESIVGVEAEHVLVAGRRYAGHARRAEAAVGPVHDADPFGLECRERRQRGRIARPVVDDDELAEPRLSAHRVDGLGQRRAVVEAGYDDRHGRRWLVGARRSRGHWLGHGFL